MVPIIVAAAVVVIVAICLYARTKKRWTIEPFPYEILCTAEDVGFMSYFDGVGENFVTIFKMFDQRDARGDLQQCFLVYNKGDLERRHLYMFKTSNPGYGPYSSELDDVLFKRAHEVVAEYYASRNR